MVNEIKCAICGKRVKGSFQYVAVKLPACARCWENFYDGIRYLRAQTRRKLQETLKNATMEVVKLEKRIEELEQEKTIRWQRFRQKLVRLRMKNEYFECDI